MSVLNLFIILFIGSLIALLVGLGIMWVCKSYMINKGRYIITHLILVLLTCLLCSGVIASVVLVAIVRQVPNQFLFGI